MILALGDAEKKKLPNALLKWQLVLSLLRVLNGCPKPEDMFNIVPGVLAEMLLCAAFLGLPFLISAVLMPGSVGGGDVKLALVLGVWLSPEGIAVVLWTMITLLITLLIKVWISGKLRQSNALGPFLCGGALFSELVVFALS